MDVYGLIGNPVGHSLSPPMHEAAYDERDIAASYVTFEPDPEDIEAVFDGAQALGIAGLNVTIPFKQSVVPFVNTDPLAERVGAVNTIDFGTTPPDGYNTDVTGVRRAFQHHNVELTGTTTVIIGAGGAGRAVAVALSERASAVRIANRTVPRAEELADNFSNGSAHELSAVPELIENADILVNATSVGMEEDESPVPASALHRGLTVLDAVYRPLQTRLLRDAEEAGAETIDGAWMLLFQGVEAFEQWTGRSAPVSVMNAALREHI